MEEYRVFFTTSAYKNFTIAFDKGDSVWTDLTAKELESVEGVAQVMGLDAIKNKYYLTFDPRYSKEAVKEAIKALAYRKAVLR